MLTECDALLYLTLISLPLAKIQTETESAITI